MKLKKLETLLMKLFGEAFGLDQKKIKVEHGLPKVQKRKKIKDKWYANMDK